MAKTQEIEPFVYSPPQTPLSLIHEDQDLLVFDKPSGLLSVPGKAAEHADSLERRVKAEYPDALLVHRLDMATSGLMIFARSPEAQRHLGIQFEKRIPKKTYIANVWGDVAGESGHINLPLICDWPNRPKQMVCFERGKPSQTDWTILERKPNITRLALHPKTGRSHQLRVHCLAMGHVILGDRFYASGDALNAAERLNLHAQDLDLRHPSGGAWISFHAPCPF